MIALAEEKRFGTRKVQYKLRDWIFSRQRYWGEPIPLVHIDRAVTDALPSLKITHDGIERIRHGSKTLETRALNPDEPHRYFGDIQARQAIVLVDREQGIRHLVRVKDVRRWDNIETLYNDPASYEMLGIGAMEYGDFRDAYAYSDTYVDQIETNGMVGFEIEYVSEIRDAIDSYVVADYSLPLLLPETPDYEPSDDGRSPLARIPEWVETMVADNLPGKRETNTMPQWGASCWYYLRFMDPANESALAGEEAMKYWGMVDEYVGGAEHAVLHLLYARFWHRVLHDIGVVPTKEPFYKLTNVGLILGENNEKMSKSRGNVVNPNDVVAEHGADTLRLYEMFMGDFTDSAPWDTTKIIGMRRLLDRTYATVVDGKNAANDDMKAMKLLHKTVKKVGEDIVAYKFNTAISAINILVNEGCPADAEFAAEWKDKLVRILHPFAPHMAEECWRLLGNTESVYLAPWPEYESFMIVDDEVTIAIQVDGKLRTTFTCLNGVAKEEVLALAYAHDIVKKWTDDKEIVREIFVPNKLLNIVTKG
jgi:leucyl-tRNA synthetase